MKKKIVAISLAIVLAPWIALPFSLEAFLFLLGIKAGTIGTSVIIAEYLK